MTWRRRLRLGLDYSWDDEGARAGGVLRMSDRRVMAAEIRPPDLRIRLTWPPSRPPLGASSVVLVCVHCGRLPPGSSSP